MAKPRIFRDIKSSGGDFGRPIEKILKSVRAGFIAFTVFYLIFGLAFVPGEGNSIFRYIDISRAAGDNAERKVLEDQLTELEKEISDHEATIEKYRAQGKGLQSEIKKLETQVAKLNLQIKAVNLNLEKLDSEIDSTQKRIGGTESDIEINKINMGRIIQSLYENDKINLVEIFLKNPDLSDFFGDLNNLVSVGESVKGALLKIVALREDLLDQKETLALEREDAAALKAYQDAQKANIKKTQNEKAGLLKETKGKESEYQKIVAEKKKTAAEIRKQIFKLLGGGELEFDNAYELAKFAEKATGVRAALVLAVLDRESALGRNVGACDYKKAMHPTRDIPAFLQIVEELGLKENLESGILKVSCANSDGAYGGAMGPAQFIPSTWSLYKDKVADVTGNRPPSPWRNADAFVATALYLKDAGAVNGSVSSERQAAAKYYAGSRWRRYLWTYGDRVIAKAQKFEEDINILSG
ncbi:lytic murein transglycosylase [Candidatus Wolfebacteria bacterium]|nr:lytic murein transglycosylase [Candidatus Wolfebacteria bacterium]